ncbi:MAG TPA: RsmB/NOP family class I SAM-dependent RNA methyltransferase [Caulobacterales bacterium]|nr:RsmB/NOP family class I SAM-dependent RNA methyltransferase [Caulobacterales bacterium]
MRPGARLAAAMEILTDLDTRHRPASDAVKDWMLSHRFAGSKDRADIGDTVFGALRWKASSAWRLGDDTPRAWVLGASRWGFGVEPDALEASFVDDPHAPEPLSENERIALRTATLDEAPPWVRGDYPQWLDEAFARAFGDWRAEEGAALAAPAPLDLRANTLKTTRERLSAALVESPRLKTELALTPYAEHGVRIPWSRGGSFPFAAEQSFQKGWFEVQDEGSQLAVELSGAEPGMQVADVCAGGGGKTLALAAAMDNKGQIYAFDVDGRRLAPLNERLDRASAHNVQIRAPARSRDVLADLHGKMDVVFVDAPCTGSGTWRRNPDAKWRLRHAALETRRREQREALALAAPLVKPGGRLMYVTCSVLPQENDDAIAAFLKEHADFVRAPLQGADRFPAHKRGEALQLTPRETGCDGFFIAALTRA